jgi:formylmethanofuran:tetrahydromethanopterin formyltransferase
MDQQDAKKKLNALTVVSNKEHKGFGAGALDLSKLSSVIIDGAEAYIDMGAIHAKSKVEKGIKFTVNREDTPNGRKCWIVWVVVGRDEQDQKYYAGVTACEMAIDSEARRGYKILADHVNRMDYALKGRLMLDGLDDTEKAALRQLLIENSEEMWANSSETLKNGLQ